MRPFLLVIVNAAAMLMFTGCAGTKEVALTLNPNLSASGTRGTGVGRPTVVVQPFQDIRTDSTHLGSRTDFWGNHQIFHLAGGEAGKVTAISLTRHLKSKGWNVSLVSADGEPLKADVVLSGQVQQLSVNAQGNFMSTDMTAATKVKVEALNVADGSTVRLTLKGHASQGVFWFEPEDAQQLVKSVLVESFNIILSATKVDHNLLRLKK